VGGDAGLTFFIDMTAALEAATKLGHFNHDAAMTMAAVLAVVVLMAYWILKT
jgi:hypothetical protein